MRIRRQARSLRSLALPAFLAVTLASVWMAGCASPAARPPTGNPNEQAAVEATAIIQRARSTALVLQAQAEATALISAASVASSGGTPSPASNVSVPAAPGEGTAGPASPAPAERSPAATLATAPPGAMIATPPASVTGELQDGDAPEGTDAGAVDLLGVEIGSDSGLILVKFKAPPSLARKWQRGAVYVVDEATGGIYNDIPVAPIIGPLFARPKAVGQQGYVMFKNTGPGLNSGARVTVVLGGFKQEHLIVK